MVPSPPIDSVRPVVCVAMDVEDPINERSDDAVLDVLAAFESAGVRGNFCVTGEKCRTLLRRGRRDVLEPLVPHCLGLHTDTHSYHPTTMELLAGVDYAKGCELAYQAESRGFASFEEAFGRAPTYWGGAGNTWSPEIQEALRRLGIPACVYALTEAPGLARHRFGGAQSIAQTDSVSELDWADDARAASRSFEVLDRLTESPNALHLVFVGHPTKFRHTRYWDMPFFGGRTPPAPEPSDPLPEDVYRRSLRNLTAFLDDLGNTASVLGLDEVLARPVAWRTPTDEERAYFERRTAENVRAAGAWPVHRPGLDIENVVRKTLALAGTLEIAC